MLILVGLAAAAEPVLGPNGWTLLGPLVGDAARDEVVFDTDTCGVEIARVDLDAGPGARDLRLARRWVSGRWEWEDDWRVEDGELRRPGRRPVPVGSELRFAGETLGLDSEGRVVRRERDGRVIEILRGNRGEFEGMRSGAVWVRIDGTVGRSWDGREVRWRWEDGELRSVADSSGLTVAYTWAEGAPLVVRWPDGNELAFSLGKSRSAVRGVVSGACELRGAGQVAVTLAAGLWNVARDGERVVVTDPGGAVVRARYAHDRLVGWMDPRGGETRIERDASGNVTSVTDPGGGRWGFTWEGGLTGVEGPDGARWAVGRGSRGVASVGEPSGRAATWERVEGGAIRSVTLGAARWEVARDGAGRVVAVTDPTGARVEVGRDAQGRAENVRDPSGGAWRLSRDASGWLVGLDDPAQGSWRVERDPVGRVVGLRTPEGGRVRWSWRPDGLPARVAWDGAPWELLWSGLGLLSGIRDPLGGTTGFERDSGGRVTTVRRADGEVVRIGRDPAGDIVRVDGVGVRRDAAGRAQGLPELETWWDLDPSGRVVGVSAPGVRLRLEREAGGALRAVVAGGAQIGRAHG